MTFYSVFSRSCLNFIINDKMNNKVWNLFHCREDVVGMLERKIKEESLCTYLFTYSQFYDNISLDWLSQVSTKMFGVLSSSRTDKTDFYLHF